MSTAQMPSLANDMNCLIYQRMVFLEGIVAGYGQDILNLKNEVCRLSKGFDSSNVLPREIPKSTATSFVFEASPSVARAAEDLESDSDLLDDQSSYSSVDASTTAQPAEMNSSKLPIIIVKPEPVATEAPDQQQSQQPPTRSSSVAKLILPVFNSPSRRKRGRSPNCRKLRSICFNFASKECRKGVYCIDRHECPVCGGNHKERCNDWNCTGYCPFKSGCRYKHSCFKCLSFDHPSYVCKEVFEESRPESNRSIETDKSYSSPEVRKRRICDRYNRQNRCERVCEDIHSCLRCGGNHPMQECSQYSALDKGYCSHLNCAGDCGFPTCTYSHKCLRCRMSGHGSVNCLKRLQSSD